MVELFCHGYKACPHLIHSNTLELLQNLYFSLHGKIIPSLPNWSQKIDLLVIRCLIVAYFFWENLGWSLLNFKGENSILCMKELLFIENHRVFCM